MPSRSSASGDGSARPFAIENEPPRERPDSPPEGYGVPRRGGTFVEWAHVLERLGSTSSYWLGTVTPDGRPHVVPIWGCLVDGELYLETGDPNTIKNRNLRANQNILVHLDGDLDVVIIRGRAEEIRPTRELGEALAGAMGGKYDGYDPTPDSWDGGGMWRVVPSSVLAWLEMPTATRWRFR